MLYINRDVYWKQYPLRLYSYVHYRVIKYKSNGKYHYNPINKEISKKFVINKIASYYYIDINESKYITTLINVQL